MAADSRQSITLHEEMKTVGGPIDVLLLTPEEVKWIQSKELHGEVNK